MISEIIEEIDENIISLLVGSAVFVLLSMTAFFIARKKGYKKIFWLEISRFFLFLATSILILLLFVEYGINVVTASLTVCTAIGFFYLWQGYKKNSLVVHIRE